MTTNQTHFAYQTVSKISWSIAFSAIVILLLVTKLANSQTPWECQTIERHLPPVGLELDAAQVKAWRTNIEEISMKLKEIDSPWEADVNCLLKACEYAIRYQEIYRAEDTKKIDRVLKLARDRLSDLQQGRKPWNENTGRQVRGYRSSVDGSVQPIGLVLPPTNSFAQNDKTPPKMPLYVWLHGRGDKTTDLHFIVERLDKDGQIAVPNAIVLHPFGRQCVGYKSAGETDVMEAIDFAVANYPVDPRRIVLMGFSMGGAGAWHLAAHYTDRFIAASPGAGFAETAQYQNIRPGQVPSYEQMLWSIYDVPGYTRNLFNIPVVAYSGELDKQIQAARVMESAFESAGDRLTHLIGPGMEHKYHPDTLREILNRMSQFADQGRPHSPSELFLETKHLRYSSQGWLTVTGQQTLYASTTIHARREATGPWKLETQNVSSFTIENRPSSEPIGPKLEIDSQLIVLPQNMKSISLVNNEPTGNKPQWSLGSRENQLLKRPGLYGPIDDAFLDPFLVVLPSRTSQSQNDNWVTCESRNFLERWESLFRGAPRIKLDHEVTEDDLSRYHIIAWGTPESNLVIRRALSTPTVQRQKLPFSWQADSIIMGPQEFACDQHILLAIYPNPLNPTKYLVLNSGPTFRQAHDRTNSLQNPHLPDWVVIDTHEPPSAETPGKIVHTGFFDAQWQFSKPLTW
ncbi:MAG: prolyl oligopeptidase family serine peptidase [Planctomycetales bacterium]|nr:prolyl oligopeptidase family serine peptidase [Planctomycetales bacterium]